MGRSPLDDAHMRLVRANQQLGELREVASEFHRDYSGKVELDDDGTLYGPQPIPDDAAEYPGLLAGEVLYHLRAALEHVAYRLAWINRGKPVRGTQFAIEDDPRMFEARITGIRPDGKPCAAYLKHIHPDHREIIRKVQPFPGGPEWAGLLRTLSNDDRHRIPVRVETVSRIEEGTIVTKDGRSLDSFAYIDAFLVFDANGKQVTKTLELLQGGVHSLVDEFDALLASR